MKKIQIQLSQQKGYTIFVGLHLIQKIGSIIPWRNYSNAIILSGSKTPHKIITNLRASIPISTTLLTIQTGEQYKNIDTVQKVWKQLHDFDCSRKSLIINVGGGMVTDIGGFAASTYLKGVHFLNIPTTLLGQVDASNGGKTGINFDNTKNLIGSFQTPLGVIADISTLSTLPKREFASGFGEIMKHGLIRNKKYFQFATSKSPHSFTQNELTEIVATSCDIKAQIVMKDAHEIRQGKILNFGHTFGHPIEVLSQQSAQPVLHGEAVIIGMMVETKISCLLHLLSQKDSDFIEQVLHKYDVPRFVGTLPISAIVKTLESQKKYSDGILRCTLLRGVGRAAINIKVPGGIVLQALLQTKKLFV